MLIKKGECVVPDESLKNTLSDEKIEKLEKNILGKLEMKWTSNKIELGE